MPFPTFCCGVWFPVECFFSRQVFSLIDANVKINGYYLEKNEILTTDSIVNKVLLSHVKKIVWSLFNLTTHLNRVTINRLFYKYLESPAFYLLLLYCPPSILLSVLPTILS